MFINQMLSLITKMLEEVPQRINLGQLETEIKMLAEIKSREEKDYQLELVPFRIVEQEISPIKSRD